MDYELIIQKISKNEERIKQVEKEEKTVDKVENEIKDILENNEELKKMQGILKKYGERQLKDELTGIMDKLLINLVSRKMTFKDENDMTISVSNSGIGYGMSGWSNQANYIKSMYRSDKFNSYMRVLQSTDKIINLIHKDDKKKILKILHKNLKGFNTLMDIVEILTDDEIIFFQVVPFKRPTLQKRVIPLSNIILRTADESYRGNIEIQINDKYYLSLQPNITTNNALNYLSLRQNEKIKKEIDAYLDKYVEVMTPFKQVVDKIKKELQPFLVMEML